MTTKLTDPRLWKSTKYISWPYTLSSPVVRVPRPTGTPESRSFPQLEGESAQALFNRCLAFRNRRGVELWGKDRWEQMLKVQARSVARHRSDSKSPYNGVYLEEREGRAPVWVACWYELMPGGKRRRRSQSFSFGTERAKYPTSNKAQAAAIERRKEEEAKWYSVLESGPDRRVNPLKKL